MSDLKVNNVILTTTIIMLIICSMIIRIPDLNKRYNNEDATYHTLLTMKCFEENPISVHKFLPIVSLGNIEDKNISWGACIKDSQGNYFYTSFSSATFVLPYIFIKMFRLPIDIYSLYFFNSIIQIASLILTIVLMSKLFSKYIEKRVIILFTTLLYLFQIEIMHSQGVIYWGHSIYQLLIVIQGLILLDFDKNNTNKIILYIMCIIMPYVEWTGFISNLAIAIILTKQNITKNKRVKLESFNEGFIVILLTTLSFVIFCTHFLLNIDINDFIYALKSRFFARNITYNEVTFVDLLKGYLKSYKYLIILDGILLLVVLVIKRCRRDLKRLLKEYTKIIFFFTFIMIENIIMLQHAVSYTFDRLKLIYLLIILFFIMIICIKKNIKKEKAMIRIIGYIILGIAMLNLSMYNMGYSEYINEFTGREKNEIISNYIKKNFNYENSILCNNIEVRGYQNMIFKRGIYEWVRYRNTAIENFATSRNKQYVIYMVSKDIMNIEKAIVVDLWNNYEYEIK